MSADRPFLSRCESCGGEMAWIKTAAREGKPAKWMPVQIMRIGGDTATDPRDTFAQGTHTPHFAVCPYADRHRGGRAKKIAEQAVSKPPPPASEMSDVKLRAAAAYYRAVQRPGPRQAARLAELEAEIKRRAREPITTKPGHDWDA